MTTGTFVRRDLRFSSLDSFLSSVMIGAGETFLPAFALAMGLSSIAAGMIATIPFLIGSFFQLAAPQALRRLGSYRRWITLMALIQGLSFFPLVLFAHSTPESGQGICTLVLFAVVTVYWACGLASGPAWSAWMSDLVPSSVRTRYFAKRSHLGQIGLLLGLVLGGLLLHAASKGGFEKEAFAGLFLTSGLFRLASAWCLSRQSETPCMVRSQKTVSLKELLSRLQHGRDGQLLFFLLLFAAAIHLASPFFNPFMLKHLQLSYMPYTFLQAVNFVTKIAAFMVLARYTDRWKPMSLMRWGIIGVSFLPVLWVFGTSLVYLSLIQFLNGIAWAAYELGVMLVLFGAIRNEERTSFMTWYNFASACMVFMGSLVGGKILNLLGDGMSTYFFIFALSTGARLLSLMVFDAATQHDRRPARYVFTVPQVGLRMGRSLAEGVLNPGILARTVSHRVRYSFEVGRRSARTLGRTAGGQLRRGVLDKIRSRE